MHSLHKIMVINNSKGKYSSFDYDLKDNHAHFK